jgi:WD40 repeat protein
MSPTMTYLSPTMTSFTRLCAVTCRRFNQTFRIAQRRGTAAAAVKYMFGGILFALLSGCGAKQSPNTTEVAARHIYSAALTTDGDFALIGAEYHGGSLWHLSTNERLYNWNHRAGEYTMITASSFSADDQWALTTDSKTLVLWNRVTGEAERFWSGTADVLALALGAEAKFALLGLADRTAVLHAVQRGGILRTFHHADAVTSVALSTDNRLALTGSADQSAMLWDVETGKALHTMVHTDPVQLVALSPDGRRALSAAQFDSVVIWDTATGKKLWQLPVREQWLKRGLTLTSARFSTDGQYLLGGRQDGIVQLWNIDQQHLVYEWRLPRRKSHQPVVPSVVSVAFAIGGDRFYAISSDGFVHALGY